MAERFWSKVDRTGECWRWTSCHDSDGYGQFYFAGRQAQAHRYAFELLVGPIPAGLVIDHMCHVKDCVNPAHLQAVTHAQNLENRSGPTRASASGVRGVVWDKKSKAWRVAVGHNYRVHHGGFFATLAEAETAAVALRNSLHTNNLADRAG